MRVVRSLFLASCLTAGVILAGLPWLLTLFVSRSGPSDEDIPGGRGAQIATLAGDPDKPGFYVVRVKFPAHVMDLPHWHPNARYVTVLQGT
jgi:hypothetical protein